MIYRNIGHIKDNFLDYYMTYYMPFNIYLWIKDVDPLARFVSNTGWCMLKNQKGQASSLMHHPEESTALSPSPMLLSVNCHHLLINILLNFAIYELRFPIFSIRAGWTWVWQTSSHHFQWFPLCTPSHFTVLCPTHLCECMHVHARTHAHTPLYGPSDQSCFT